MKRLLAIFLALLLAVPFPVYAGATPSDADFDSSDYNYDVDLLSYNMAHYGGVVYNATSQSNQYRAATWNSAYGVYEVSVTPPSYVKEVAAGVATNGSPAVGRYYLVTVRMNSGNVGWTRYNPIPKLEIRYVHHDASNGYLSRTIQLTRATTTLNNYTLVTQFYIYLKDRPDSFLLWYPIPSSASGQIIRFPKVDFLPLSVSFTLTSKDHYDNNNLQSVDWSDPAKPDSSTDDEIKDAVSSIQDSVVQLPGKIDFVGDAVQDVVQGIANLPQNIAGALEPHYDNILQQLHHITEQLHALWDQLAAYFNDKLIPQMITDTNRIVEAIENVNHEVNIDLDALMQQLTQQHKEQLANDNKNTEEIVNGYENGDMDSINGEFGTAAENSDNAEDQLFNEVSGNISDFTFDLDMLSQYQTSLTIIGKILGHFVALPFVKTPMVFMLTLSIALIMIGYYRFKGGG